MTPDRHLRIALVIVGAAFIATYPTLHLWPSGFRWQPRQDEYEQMIVVLSTVLGISLLRAARNPLAHLSLIRFTIWSSLAHAAVMTCHALADPGERTHLIGDVPALMAVAVTLAALTPHRAPAKHREPPTS